MEIQRVCQAAYLTCTLAVPSVLESLTAGDVVYVACLQEAKLAGKAAHRMVVGAAEAGNGGPGPNHWWIPARFHHICSGGDVMVKWKGTGSTSTHGASYVVRIV